MGGATPTKAPTASRLASAFIGIAALIGLLIFGGLMAWRNSKPMATPGSQARGPLDKVSLWVEPPPQYTILEPIYHTFTFTTLKGYDFSGISLGVESVVITEEPASFPIFEEHRPANADADSPASRPLDEAAAK